MGINWISGFFVPLIKVVFIGGFLGFITFIVCRAVYRVWKRRIKWFLKYKIARNRYDDKIVAWCVNAIDKEVSYADLKMLLMLSNKYSSDQANEIMWIYVNLARELKGGKNGRKFERSYRKIEATTLPTFQES